jgi:Right handed beta helix region
MSEIYAPGSIAGPQGPAGPAGSQGSVTALASSVLPVPGNLFDLNKVSAGYAVQSDGTLAAAGGWASSGLIYCAGMTSMVTNLPIDPLDATFALYDANGNFAGALAAGNFGSTFLSGCNQLLGGAAFPLPGTQVYVRFSWMVPRMGSYGSAASLATAMVFAGAGTAMLPATFAPFGFDTPGDVNAKDAAVAANAAAALAASLTGATQTFAQAALPGPHGPNRNAFDYLSPIAGSINSSGGIDANAGWSSAMVYAPGSTSAITNIPIWVEPGGVSVCTYDAMGNFLADITSTLAPYAGPPSAPTSHLRPNVVFPLPGNQTYVKFSYNGSFASWSYPGSAASCVFYSGTAAAPCPSSLTALNMSTPFAGNAPVNVKTASQLGCTIDGSLDCTAPLNAFLATASAANPIKLILDGMFLTTGLVISPNGYTTIEGIGAGSGIFVLNGSNQDGIRIGAYTAATGQSEGAYNIAAPARTAKHITLRDFTVNANSAQNGTGPGQGLAAADTPVAGAPVHTIFGVILANCSDVTVDNVNFLAAPSFALALSNANNIFVRGCTFISTGTLHDGVHINGKCEDIAISDCYFSTGDDAIALNAPEGYGGDISRVTVTNCVFDNSLTVMRAYTSLDAAAMPSNNVHRIRNVVVANCTGTTTLQCFNLGITNGGLSATADAGQLQDFSVENCTLSSPLGLAYLLTPIGSLSFRNVKFIPASAAPVISCYFSSVGELELNGVRVVRNPDGNAAPASVVYLYSGVAVDRVSIVNFAVVDEEGSSYPAVPCILDNNGALSALRLEAIDMTHIAALVSAAGWAGVAALRGGGVLGAGVQVPDAVMDANALYLSSNAGGAPSIKVGGTAKRLTLA